MPHKAYIALGSNLGEREKNLERAIDFLASLADIKIAARSSVLETAPVDYTNQPDFFNQMICIETCLDPEDLLKTLKNAEKILGRKESFLKGPRLIDLDIILYDELVYSSSDLTIPHKERYNRHFIIRHLAELDPALRDPVTGEAYRDTYQLL